MIQNAATVAAIAALDFTTIKWHLMRAARTGWSAARADAVELEYRRFLYLIKLHPDEALAPLADVDQFWHCHIGDSRKYASDCQRVFGRLIHHHAHLDAQSAEAEQALQVALTRARDQYEQVFGKAPAGQSRIAHALPGQPRHPVRDLPARAQQLLSHAHNVLGLTPLNP